MNGTREPSKTDDLPENKAPNTGKTDFFDNATEIRKIAEQADGINELFFEFAGPYLEFFCGYLHISKIQAAIYALLICRYDGGEIRIYTLQHYFPGKIILAYIGELEVLEEKGLIHINRERKDYRTAQQNMSFELRLDVIDSLRKGYYHNLTPASNISIDEFFVQLERLCQDRIQARQSYSNIKSRMKSLLQDNEHLIFVQKIQGLSLSDDDMLILLRFFHYMVILDEPEMDFHILSALYEHDSDFIPVKRQLKNGTHILLTRRLIENTCSDGFSDTESFRLTDETKEKFLVELDQVMFNIPVKGLKRSDSIAAKNLFYPEKTQTAINELTVLLQPEHFSDVQKRLGENGMRTGFACLFSGGPGTGKTETAWQLARKTGRDIMCVDIANTKSKWFGESEKQIKAVFDKYRSCVKKSAITPILLFNEADAVFGKRRQIGENHNGPAQTENAIQNIILLEIENLNGILIATTNLSKNMDAAFERRFLYKIEFDKPEIETRTAIWRSMITGLCDTDVRTLADRFDFSGGQIENIARKSTVHRIISGTPPVLEDIIRFCAEENMGRENAQRIGFAV